MSLESFLVDSFVMGYHDYQHDWTPCENEILPCIMEPTNVLDKYAVAVVKENKVIGHLMKGQKGNFAKIIFYFLNASSSNVCNCKVIGKPVNLGSGMGMQVPCKLIFSGQEIFISKLKKLLC